MRLLFTFAGGSGHFDPLVPIARAAQTAGHQLAFAGEPALVPIVEAQGFTAFPTGSNTSSTERLPLLALDADREDRALREGYARRTARRRAADLIQLCHDWQPDLLVCDEVDFGAMLAAERLGLPYASVIVIASGSFIRNSLVAEPLNELRAEHGLSPDPALTMLSRYLVLSPFPPSYRDPAYPLPPTAHFIRPPVAQPTAPPPWATALPGAPVVYFTLGTVFNLESGDLFSRVLTGLRQLPLNLIVTLGRQIDPAEFGPQPPNVRLERHIPQALVMPHCDLVVSHGGSGSVGGALAHGLPMLLIPLGADQPHNAARCSALGLALVLDPLTATAESVREAASTVLADPAFRQAAGRLSAEAAALPGPAHAVTLLERLAVERQPILSA